MLSKGLMPRPVHQGRAWSCAGGSPWPRTRCACHRVVVRRGEGTQALPRRRLDSRDTRGTNRSRSTQGPQPMGGTRSRRSIHSPSSLVTECAPLSCSASPSAPSAASSAIAASRQPAKAARPGVRRSNSHSNTWSTPTWQAGWSASGSHHSPGPRPPLGALIVRLGQLKMFYARACQPYTLAYQSTSAW
jgi:hypothetical protein